jgi:flagellar biosynthesis GTPase FlhF
METLTKPPAEQMIPSQVNAGNQDPLAKLEFEGIDPRFSDVVYHFTPEENLEAISREGLRYSDRYDEAWGKAEDLMMNAKPADTPVDLKHTVFAQLEQRHLGTTNGIAALRTNMEKGESIAVAVDPHDTYVGDAANRENHVGAVAGYGNPAKERENFWDGVMPLATFRELYKPSYDKPDEEYGWDEIHWELKDPNNADKLSIPRTYSKPELYIPLEAGEDAIPTERLAHTASSLVGRVETSWEVEKRISKENAEVAEAQRKAEADAEREEWLKQYEEEKRQREAAREEKEKLQRKSDERAKRLGTLGLQLAELYEEHKDAATKMDDAAYNENLQRSSSMLAHGLARKHIEAAAIKDANAAGHDINFGGQHYPAESSEEERKAA